MYLTRQQVMDMDRDALIGFLNRRISEGHHLDYKVALSGDGKVRQHREFLKDVSAFANANGGDILIGVGEPDADSPVDILIQGVEHGDDLAHDLERLCSSDKLDPRISGLLFHPVDVGEGLWVIVVHIPPSLGKPHMVRHEKQVFLLQRHSESVQPMTSHDIRQAALSVVTAEDRARRYSEKHRSRLANVYRGKCPFFIVQATPLTEPESPLDVLGDPVINALKGPDRFSNHNGERMGLSCMPYPEPTVEGVHGFPNRPTEQEPLPDWTLEVHRNGYMAVAFKLADYDRLGRGHDGSYCIRDYHQNLFIAFGEFCNEIVTATEFDPPHIVECCLLNARDSVMVIDRGCSRPCDRDVIEWPPNLRQPGDSFLTTMVKAVGILFNGYGLKKA